MRCLLSACVGTALFVLSGCATTVDPETRRSHDREIARLENSTVAIVADGCVVRDEIGSDYVLRDRSELAGSQAAGHVRDYLQQQGFSVGTVMTPFVCGSVQDQEVDGVMANDDADPKRFKLPLVLEPRLKTDTSAKKAFQRLLTQALTREEDEGVEADVSFPRPLRITAAEASLLKRDLGTSDVWLVLAAGGEVSAGKSIGLGILIGVASVAASGGTVFSTTVLRDGNTYRVALADLESLQLRWANGVPVAPGEAGSGWGAETAKVLFEPLLDGAQRSVARNTLEKGISPQAAAPMSVPPAALTTIIPEPAALAPTAVPGIPLTAVALPLPESVVLTFAAELRNRPAENGSILRHLDPGTTLRTVSSAYNTSGFWVFVRTEDGQPGWIRMERVKTAQLTPRQL